MPPRLHHLLAISVGLAASLTAGSACAADGRPGDNGIYSCVDAQGRRLTSDRPIRECIDREQRVLNRDGSQKRVLPPSLTADEKAVAEEAQRRRQAEMGARLDAIKRDRNLLARFPNEEAHQKAREAALDDVRGAIRLSELRLEQLRRDRKPLDDEADFYRGRPLPPKLRASLDVLDAGVEAQRTLIQNQNAEMARINALFDVELGHLRRLWAGAPVGSLPYPQAASGASAATPVSASASLSRPASASTDH